MAPRPPAVHNFQQGEDLEDLEHVTENFQGEKQIMWSMLRIRIETTQPGLNGQDLDDFLSVRDEKDVQKEERHISLLESSLKKPPYRS